MLDSSQTKQPAVTSPYGNNYFGGGSLPIFERVKTAQSTNKKSSNRYQDKQIFQNAMSQLNNINKGIQKYNQAMNDQGVLVGSQDLRTNGLSSSMSMSQRQGSFIHSNFGRVQNKVLQPTLSLSQQQDVRGQAERSFAAYHPSKLGLSFEQEGMENQLALSDLQIDILSSCLQVKKSHIYTYNELNEPYYAIYGKNFVEDLEPVPLMHYERNPQTGDYKVDKLRHLLPKVSLNDEYAKLTQKERDQYMKIQHHQDIMGNIISSLKRRDTKGNIESIQKELDELAARNNPLKKCLSMYKIKQKMDQLKVNTLNEESYDDTKPGQQGRDATNPSGLSNKNNSQNYKGEDQFNIEEEGKMRYKILTNFVNAYKEKMFLSSSVGFGDSKNQASEKDNMTLQDLKEQAMVQRSDITLDFEQFIRIYNFEKNRSTKAKNVLIPNHSTKSNIDQQNQLAFANDLQRQSKSIDKQGGTESYIVKSPKQTSNALNSSLFQKRPISSFGREIQEQKSKLMKKTNMIRKNVEENKSLIEGAKQRKRQEQDDQEIARQVDMIKKKNLNKRTQRYEAIIRQKASMSNMDSSQWSPNGEDTKYLIGTKSGVGMIQDGSTQFIRGGTPLQSSLNQTVVVNSRPQTTGNVGNRNKSNNVNLNNRRLVSGGGPRVNYANQFDDQNEYQMLNDQKQGRTFDKNQVNYQSQSAQRTLLLHNRNKLNTQGIQSVASGSQSLLGSATKINKSLQTASNLAKLYTDCIQEMNTNLSMKSVLKNAQNIYRNDVSNVNCQIADISKGIKSEQIKYKKFDNYAKK
eukprot:403341667